MLQVVALAKEKEDFVVIKGYLDFEPKKNKISLQTANEGFLEDVSETKLSENRAFGFVLDVTKPGFYHVQIPGSNNLIRLYLQNGEEINIEVSEDTYTLSGKNIGYNKLVAEWNKVVAPLLVINREASKTYQDFFPYMKETVLPKAAEIKNKLKTKDEHFNNLMSLAVQTDVEQQSYAFWFIPRSLQTPAEKYRDFYSQWDKPVKFTNKDILELWNGKSYMKGYLQNYQWIYGEDPKSQFHVENAIASIAEPQLRDIYLRSIIEIKGVRTNQYQTFIKDARPHMISEESKSLLFKYDQNIAESNGRPGFNFEYEDINGDKVSFSSLQGKLVYVDMWATWCGPCIKQIPYLKQLEEDFHGEDIVFVSISIDEAKDKAKWKKFVEAKELGGIQLIADKAWDSEIVKNYEVKGIPRFMIFDKEGNVVNDNAMRPSQPELKAQLLELLKK